MHVKFIIHRQIQLDGQRGIAWAKAFLNQFDTSRVDWMGIDVGRDYKGTGRPSRRYLGVYGRCLTATLRMLGSDGRTGH